MPPVIVRMPERPGTRPTLAPVDAELQRRGHVVVADGPCDVALCCTADDARALHRVAVGPLAFTPMRSNPGRGWARELRRVSPQVDLLFLPGPIYLDVLPLAAPEHPPVEIAGLPRVDALRAAASTRPRITALHGLDPGRPLVVFAPRWHQTLRITRARGHGTLSRLAEVVAAAAACGAELLVLPHPREHTSQRLALAAHVARVEDATPYLCAADVLVTDFSPLAAEFAVRGRPIIQLIDVLERRLPRLVGPTNPREHEAFDVGEQVRACELGPVLAAACGGQDPAGARRRAWVERLFAWPGEAAARHADALERLAVGRERDAPR